MLVIQSSAANKSDGIVGIVAKTRSAEYGVFDARY